MPQNIVVVCRSTMPRFCAGVMFEGAQSFPLDRFTHHELRDIANDRLLSVVVGTLLHADHIDEVVQPAAELVSGLAVYPAGSQAAVLPADGGVLVDPATAGGVVDGKPHMGPVVAHGHKGAGRK